MHLCIGLYKSKEGNKTILKPVLKSEFSYFYCLIERPIVKRILLILFQLFLLVSTAWATHNRAGEITYRHISGNTYEVTIHTYTKTSSAADRPFLPINWGDGTPADSIARDQIIFTIGGNFNVQENLYIKRHTFPGAGAYDMCVSDPNRINDILNIANSVEVVFAIQTTLRISASIAANNSVIFTNLPIQDACLFQPWVYNPGAVDPDGNDSLSFKLVVALGPFCEPFSSNVYAFPNEIDPTSPPPNPLQELSIDPISGTVIWEVPQRAGIYNLAILVEEWRDGFLISKVLRDMQIDVITCANIPPVLEELRDTCVEAGTTLSIPIFANDTPGSEVEITGFGSPFVAPESQALISQFSEEVPIVASFNWATTCAHVQLGPYQATIQATDNGPGVNLTDIETFNITVVAPAPENLMASSSGISIEVTWDESICANAIGYKLFKRLDPFGFFPSFCETGVPGYTGYVEIAELDGLNSTVYLDTEITFGRDNCYIVIAYFEDGAESYASNEICSQAEFVRPILKKNSVGITDVIGVDTVHWRSPVELDLDLFPGPYQYKLFRSNGYANPNEMVFESSVETDFGLLQSTFTDISVNTAESAQTYRVELYSGGEFLVSSSPASSLFLELIPNDNQMEVNWIEAQDWRNFAYDIYRQDDGAGSFNLIATIDTIGYLDEGLVNNREYCYYVVSYGSYNSPLENDTLINFSQQLCGKPYDRTPPCPPELLGEGDCETFIVDLEWTNPNETCPETDDVVEYNIYFTPVEGQPMEVIETLAGSQNTIIQYFLDNSIAGCYAVTALDSLAMWPDGEFYQNESELSNMVCFDNCPNYLLPNVMTPNGDGKNDFFSPFPYRSIDSIELTIFNRWGDIVFETTDPDILWNGTNTESGELVSDGVYFYTCTVYSIRLNGLEPIGLSGYVTVFVEGGNGSE